MSGDEGRIERRLVGRASPACWIGLCVKVIAAGERVEDGRRVRTPEHFLAAAWPPPADGWARWPEAVVIGSPTATRTLGQLFRHLPAEARLHLAGLDDVDAGLAAEIVLAADRHLEAYQREALKRFVEIERKRMCLQVAARYTDRDAAFERFRARVVGPGPDTIA